MTKAEKEKEDETLLKKLGRGQYGITVPFEAEPRHEYEKGHPCRGCPCQFPVKWASCTLGATPGQCWYSQWREREKREREKQRIEKFEQRFRKLFL